MRLPIRTFSALLALSLTTSCATPKLDSNVGDLPKDPATQEVIKTDTPDPVVSPIKIEPKNASKPDIKKGDSIVLATLNVEPTPGLIASADFRQRGESYGGQGGMAGSFAESGIGFGGGPGVVAPTMAPAPRAEMKPMDDAPAMPEPMPAKKKSMVDAKGDKSAGGEGDGFGYHQAAIALKAGEIDDNKNFEDYLSYVQKKSQLAGVAHVDVTKRIQLTITDDAGKPVHDAKVTLMIDGKPWLRAKSHTDGRLVFFPNAAGALPQGKATIKVEKGDATFEKELAGFATKETVKLSNATASQGVARLDLVFCIDTTGSMGDEIAQIQSTVQEIITKTKNLPAKPELRMGMVLFGDRGDIYTTRVYDFTTDADKFKSAVSTIAMTGGGDIPEDLNSGMEDAIESLEWNNQESARMVFLIGDAAPHMDYQQKYDYKVSALRAAEQGIKIFPLASSGLEDVGEFAFRQLALFTEGHFLFLTYGAQGETTSMNVDRDSYTPDKLDDVIVKLITQELKPLSK